jgi:hypothetical protein
MLYFTTSSVLDYKVSSGRMTDDWRLSKRLQRAGRGLIEVQSQNFLRKAQTKNTLTQNWKKNDIFGTIFDNIF